MPLKQHTCVHEHTNTQVCAASSYLPFKLKAVRKGEGVGEQQREFCKTGLPKSTFQRPFSLFPLTVFIRERKWPRE